MNILVIGSGGREHALCKKFKESPLVEAVYCAPGNDGMKKDGIKILPIAQEDHPRLMTFAKAHHIDWTFVGPEVPLINGIVNDFKKEGLKIFGPSQAAAELEGSKDFTKQLLQKYKIPTAEFKTFTDYDLALTYIREKGAPIVIKADGLAAGKGVVVAMTLEEAEQAVTNMLKEAAFGEAGQKIVIEEFLEGEEFSLMNFVKDDVFYPMVIAQDHKRAYDGDLGPNTGGMGAYAPVYHLPNSAVDTAIQTIVEPTVKAMIAEGRPFTGILYAGLILTQSGPKVIEFNARFGDPETQVILERLDSDLAKIVDDLLNDKEPQIEWKEEGITLGVVYAAKGYPGSYAKGASVEALSDLTDVKVIYSGVKEEKDTLVSNGGRVAFFMTSADSIEKASDILYSSIEHLDTEHFFYRKDIGFKERK